MHFIKMTLSVIFVYCLTVLTQVRQMTAVEIKIEAESMDGDLMNVMDRINASGLKTVHLFEGESIQKQICLVSPGEISAVEVAYTNDGRTDLIEVKLMEVVIGVVHTETKSDQGREWNVVKYSYTAIQPKILNGKQYLAIVVAEADHHGVEIDFIKFTLNHTKVTQDSFECKVFCFDEIVYPGNTGYNAFPTPRGRAEQKSVKNLCAEEDNVDIPIFHENPKSFTIVAHMPKYQTFTNNRDPDWLNCKFFDKFWAFKNIDFVETQKMNYKNNQMTLTVSNSLPSNETKYRKVGEIEVDFELEGPNSGLVASEVGTRTVIEHSKFTGVVIIRYQYFNRYNEWSDLEEKVVNERDHGLEFSTPDASFREGSGNKVRIEIYSNQKSNSGIIIGHIFMCMRWLQPGKSVVLYRDRATVIEGVDVDSWWRINETMTVSFTDNDTLFGNVDFIRIYRRVPWTESGMSQIFVLYQDGNTRLLPLTPHGLDWIPFGSSVIIGQANRQFVRPSAPISRLDIDPILLNIMVSYKDGSEINLQIKTTATQTQVHASDCKFTNDLNVQPFVTFRSMFVENGNSDVDHVTVDGGVTLPIINSWKTLYGNFFAFYRKCISKHNTLSPDITVSINSQ